ncbi:MAG: alanine racemase [Gammaproteobacteria bacterium]
MTRPTRITINLGALQNNLQQIRQLAPNSAVIAMVKSNAYGHGLERIASALPNADALGVACSEEGLLLREVGVKPPIVLMEGLFSGDELSKAIENNFVTVVHHVSQVEMLEKNPDIQPLSIWLKIDTGMHRLGFEPGEVKQVYKRLQNCPAVKKPIGLMTHFAESDSIDRTPTLQQIEIFNSVTANLSGQRSLANSAGILAWPAAHADWVRPGIILYGASPFVGHRGVEHHLQPVMTLTSELIAIHDLVKGARVGYGGTWICPENMRIGVVGIGYGDGYPRHAQNGTPVLVNGRSCPLAGRVSMDMLTVDLRTQPNAKVGDPVLLWGDGLPVEVIAEHSGTSGYELLTRITQRVHVVVQS